MEQDREHLKLLSVFHYVVAGFALLFSLFPILHLVIGLGLATGAFEGADEAARTMGWFFAAFAGLWVLLGLAYAACMAVAGRRLARRQGYTFCLVMAAVSCAFVPMGTVLGIFTLLVLQRESVKVAFGGASAAVGTAE